MGSAPTRVSRRRNTAHPRARFYLCRHAADATGLCDAPPIDADLIDTHVVNELHRYLGDFDAWREQLESRLFLGASAARAGSNQGGRSFEEHERACERSDRLASVASNDSEAKAALRIAAKAQEELERRQRRLQATREALDSVPDEAPADAMLDFYNEHSAAVRGRLDGANTISRVNDALRDVFEAFILSPPSPEAPGICVTPIARTDRALGEVLTAVTNGDEHSKWIKDPAQGWRCRPSWWGSRRSSHQTEQRWMPVLVHPLATGTAAA